MAITVGVVGLLIVGKSSLINSLKRCHVVTVGATPGLTRTMQEVQLDKNVKLLDCPGVVMLNSGENAAAAALRNCIKIEKLEDSVASVQEILEKCPSEMLVTAYKIPVFASADDFLSKVAIVRGKLNKGGILDTAAAARIVLRDWNEGLTLESQRQVRVWVKGFAESGYRRVYGWTILDYFNGANVQALTVFGEPDDKGFVMFVNRLGEWVMGQVRMIKGNRLGDKFLLLMVTWFEPCRQGCFFVR